MSKDDDGSVSHDELLKALFHKSPEIFEPDADALMRAVREKVDETVSEIVIDNPDQRYYTFTGPDDQLHYSVSIPTEHSCEAQRVAYREWVRNRSYAAAKEWLQRDDGYHRTGKAI